MPGTIEPAAATAGDRRALRLEMRRQRREFTGPSRDRAERSLRAYLQALPAFRAAHRVATFAPFDGEPDLGARLTAHKRKQFFVPILDGNRMRFARLPKRPRWRRNFFGILEPADPEFIDPRMLDLVLTPLVAFDGRGVRLGVGRGYYDRCFRFLRRREIWTRPKLLGVAFSLQRLTAITAYDWDVPLWGVVTEHGAQIFHRES